MFIKIKVKIILTQILVMLSILCNSKADPYVDAVMQQPRYQAWADSVNLENWPNRYGGMQVTV